MLLFLCFLQKQLCCTQKKLRFIDRKARRILISKIYSTEVLCMLSAFVSGISKPRIIFSMVIFHSFLFYSYQRSEKRHFLRYWTSRVVTNLRSFLALLAVRRATKLTNTWIQALAISIPIINHFIVNCRRKGVRMKWLEIGFYGLYESSRIESNRIEDPIGSNRIESNRGSNRVESNRIEYFEK